MMYSSVIKIFVSSSSMSSDNLCNVLGAPSRQARATSPYQWQKRLNWYYSDNIADSITHFVNIDLASFQTGLDEVATKPQTEVTIEWLIAVGINPNDVSIPQINMPKEVMSSIAKTNYSFRINLSSLTLHNYAVLLSNKKL